MARTNDEVEQALMEYADLLSILTDDPYKPRAYEKAARAVGRIKRAVCSGIEMPFGEALALERELQQQLFQSEDAHEGLAAYVEKRTPHFKAK